MKYLIVIALLAVSCDQDSARREGSTYTQETTYIGKYESSEVICFINSYRGGIFCKFKENGR